MVVARSAALIPVVIPSRASTDVRSEKPAVLEGVGEQAADGFTIEESMKAFARPGDNATKGRPPPSESTRLTSSAEMFWAGATSAARSEPMSSTRMPRRECENCDRKAGIGDIT
jgi:hypothetical protein